jgi:2-haloacid dehalogenase
MLLRQVMMVAAHQDDLAHARACGLKTAYIERPQEYGPSQEKDVSPNADIPPELAAALNC